MTGFRAVIADGETEALKRCIRQLFSCLPVTSGVLEFQSDPFTKQYCTTNTNSRMESANAMPAQDTTVTHPRPGILLWVPLGQRFYCGRYYHPRISLGSHLS